LLLYLDVEPEECYRRMSSVRMRSAESGVPLEYLDKVDAEYFRLLLNWLAKGLGDRTDDDMNVGTPIRPSAFSHCPFACMLA
jgi:hypothetical protein